MLFTTIEAGFDAELPFSVDLDTAQYNFKVDDSQGSVIPQDPKFYQDMFANGTSIGMKMFEQDFLCTLNTDTNLTNNDLTSGETWMADMDAAAKALNVTLQWCMINPNHALASTKVHQMTNARATSDNCRNAGAADILPLGQNSVLYHALGFFASRDNVWTSPPEVNQTDCASHPFCFEPSHHADNAVAVLGGGPYGIADQVGTADAGVVLRSCRVDGVLMRAKLPLAAIDATFTSAQSSPLHGAAVWAAHDEPASNVRYSYVLAIDTHSDIHLRLGDLSTHPSERAVVYSVQLGGSNVQNLTMVPSDGSILLPASTLTNPYIGVSHVAVRCALLVLLCALLVLLCAGQQTCFLFS